MIDDVTYSLPKDNYLTIENPKKQIVIGHTFNNNMKHFKGWLLRHNGKYKTTTPYTVDTNGNVYEHFNPKYQSKYFKNTELDNKSIVILLENDGWLLKNTEKNEFITWIGDIYKQPELVVEKRWRGYNYWSPYPKKQIESVISLVRVLCGEFNIPPVSINHNTRVDDLIGYEGVLYKSNLEKHYTDLSPSWDCEEFKNKL
jgi:N-acetyl-anhydromuramyl-L-alanine amidase AmpD